ncbi:hypothetical protein Tco_0651471 [Tanacetum coccineum]|uniref:Uncharacterized protein n=1 Tax=Tanacetum coccineum TaxID=301880 RepID=A0ABQ4WUW5_9ASTR
MPELNKNDLFTASALRVYLVIHLNGVHSAREQTKQAKVNLSKQDEVVMTLFKHRTRSDEAKEKLKKLDADEVYTQSQLDVKNFSSLLNLKLAKPYEDFRILYVALPLDQDSI